MSRCFPFPPPGYEKKPRSDHEDLLAKEKHKEKKHKKEKDRGKREGKERRDKDRNKDKHREKKDRKEKHKEKKRDKEKNKEKRTSDDRKIEEQEGRYEDKLGDSSWKDEEFQNSKFTEELGRRIKDDGAANQMFENNISSIQGGVEGFGAAGTAMEKDKGDGNKMVTSLVSKEHKRNDGIAGPVEKDTNKKIEGLDKAKDMHEMVARLVSKEQRGNDGFGRAVDQNVNKKIEGKKSKDRFEMVANLTNNKQTRNDRMYQSVEKYVDKKIEGKEKAKDMHDAVTDLVGKDQGRGDKMGRRPMEKDADKNIGGKEKAEADDRKGDKHKERDRDKKHRRKDKDRHKEKEKEKEKEEKINEKGEHRHKEPDVANEDEKKNSVIKPLVPHKDSEKCPGTEGNIKKRKDFLINGFLHENDGQPNKLPRPMPSSHLHNENGRTLESCHVANPHSSIKHGATNNMDLGKVLDKKGKINGVGVAPSSVDLRSSLGATTSRNSEAPIKPPHPDSEYLSLIYCVPKMEEWPEFDDQEWLFSSKAPEPKPKTVFKAEETPFVWAEALQIKSADVLALPYVIPY